MMMMLMMMMTMMTFVEDCKDYDDANDCICLHGAHLDIQVPLVQSHLKDKTEINKKTGGQKRG